MVFGFFRYYLASTFSITCFQMVTEVTTRKTLDKLQWLICACITGAMRTFPTAALEVILDLTTLHAVVEGGGPCGNVQTNQGGDKILCQRA
ncbi:hypothetical protein Trydic_g19288 [Trypoxylus dichotomus]